MKEEIEINVPMEALLQDPELYLELMHDEYDDWLLCQEMKEELLTSLEPKMIEVLAHFSLEPTIERKNCVIIHMNMYKYWSEREVNR